MVGLTKIKITVLNAATNYNKNGLIVLSHKIRHLDVQALA